MSILPKHCNNDESCCKTSSLQTHVLKNLQIIILLITISASLQFSLYASSTRRRFLDSKVYHNDLLSQLSIHQRSTLSSTKLWALSSTHQYQVGEEVFLLENDDATLHNVGIIEQKKGGWYTVCTKHDSTRVKRRASQLKRSTSDVKINNAGAAPTSTPSATRSSIDNAKNEKSTTLPPAEIVDLDSILQQHKHTKELCIQNSTTNNHTAVLSETIQQITDIHSHYNQWLIFSDLHVMPSTLPTCIEILNFIHTTALNTTKETGKPTGILFLGDFWHHRGFIRINCLNAILETMSTWTVPCIMIPGNHDQIDWRGVEHALTPLQNAYRIQRQEHAGPLIITHPTKFLNALFVPHIRDKLVMKSILSSDEATSSDALFVHADVKGARMNDLIKSRHGLDGTIFPRNKLIYSGHFHKPHTVQIGKKNKNLKSNNNNCISIRYVGSPYQTSYSESGQSKSLLLVDSNKNWECIQEIPIDIGPRYHRISSVDNFLDLPTDMIRKGDKVAVSVCQNELEEIRILAGNESDDEESVPGNDKSLFDMKLKELRDAGIAVEIRDGQKYQDGNEGESSNSAALDDNENSVDLEDLSPKATLVRYLDNEVESGEIGEVTAKRLLAMGEQLLGETTKNGDSLSPSSSPTNDAIVPELEIESVSVRGFGSFNRETVYPLKDRGVVLLRGTNKDFGSDSNGVGKSTLAMASLWALAGSTDPRPTQDGKVTDVVNDLSKVAQVTLSGSINSKPFLVKRTKSISSKGSSLTFILDGVDLTRQSSKDTQQSIDDHFKTESQMLMRTIFHGQHSIGGLLESSDAKLKEELSYLVSLEIWQQSASLSRSKQRELMRKESELDGMLSIREQDESRARDKVEVAEVEMKKRKRLLENEREILLQKEKDLSVETGVSGIEAAMDSVQTQLHQCDHDIIILEEELSKFKAAGTDELDALRTKLNEKLKIEIGAKATLQDCQRKYDVAMMELKSAESQLSHVQSEWNVNTSAEDASSSASPPATCSTCGQPIISSTAQKHVTENIEKKVAVATNHFNEAKDRVALATDSLEEAEKDAKVQGLEVQSCMKRLHEAEEVRSLATEGLRQKIKEARSIQSKLSADFASLVRKAKEMSELDLVQSRMKANIDRLNESYKSSVKSYKDCCSDVEMIKASIVELKRDRESLASKASLYTLLAETFGPKGIQAFVLRNIVQALQYCSQTYLNELSDGSLQLRIQVGSNDSIVKQAAVRSLDGSWRVRPLSSLSGGQWRRCALSLSLGFIDLASKRGKMRSSLLVLDEPLTHLDTAGRKSVGKLLRKMLTQDDFGFGVKDGFGLSTILIILQEIAAEEIEECFDQIDEVIKHGGESFVVLDKNQSIE